MNLKRVIESERVRLDMTKTEMAAALNIAPATYRAYLAWGKIPAPIIIKMCDLFDCTSDYLLGRTDIRKPPGKEVI